MSENKNNNVIYKRVDELVGEDVTSYLKVALKAINDIEKYQINKIGFVPVRKNQKEKIEKNKKIISLWMFCELKDNENNIKIKPNMVLNFSREKLKDKKLIDFYDDFLNKRKMYLIDKKGGYFVDTKEIKDVEKKINKNEINWEEKLKKGTKIYKAEKEIKKDNFERER